MLHSLGNSRIPNKLLSAFLALFLLVSMVPTWGMSTVAYAAENESEQAVPLSDFSQGVLYPGRQRTQAEIEELQSQGYIADYFDASDIDYKNSISSSSTSNLNAKSTQEALPEKVDMRNTNKVTKVDSQGATSTCWAWAAAATAETSIANSTGQAATKFSPFQLAYFAYTPLSTQVSDLQGTEKSQAGEGISTTADARKYLLNFLGYQGQAASLMMSGAGVALTSSIPFPTSSLNDGIFLEKDSLTSEQRRERVARLSQWNFLGSLIITSTSTNQDTTTTEYVGTDESVLSNMKQTLADGNAVAINYFGDTNQNPEADVYFNHKTNAQYTYEYQPSNHVVCVVGYDDTYSKENFIEGHQPEKDGAFIVKNSWGTGWGDEGYFYLSYYDRSIVAVQSYEFDTSNYDANNIDDEEIIDQYDYMQMLSYEYNEYDLSSTPNKHAWYSNMYTASQKQSLHSIATYVVANVDTLGYKVYKLTDNATSPKDIDGDINSPVDEGTLDIENEGYVRIELDNPLNLQQGEKYAIWFYQTDGDNKYYISQVRSLKDTPYYTSTAVVNEQESFNSSDPALGWDAMDTSKFDQSYAYDNYCVKGYATSCAQASFITFNSNGGTNVPEQVVANGEKATEPNAPTKDGATFAGWYKDSALTQPFSFNTETISADTTLYAAWEYDITYELDGGMNASTNPEAYIAGIGVASFSNPTKTGYDFAGWWSENGTTTGNWGTKITSISANSTGSTTLYAKWNLIEYTITYQGVEGVDNPNVTHYTIESDTIVLKDVVKEGYQFLGWYMQKTQPAEAVSRAASLTVNAANNSAGEASANETNEYGEKVTQIENGSYGNITLTACWEAQENGADGTTPATPSDPTTPNKAVQSSLSQTGDASFAFMVVAFATAVVAFGCARYVAKRKVQQQHNKH